MNSQTEITHFCDCEKWARSACSEGELFEYGGKRYCVLHYPDEDKVEAFRVAVKKKLDAQDFNFLGVWFPEPLDFQQFQFTANAHFRGAIFNGEATFIGATFRKDTYFNNATFNAGANFGIAAFSGRSSFAGATFCEKAYFYQATFSGETNFNGGSFSGETNFDNANFGAGAYFNNAKFRANASLAAAEFRNGTYFRQAAFNMGANFSGSTFSGYADFYGTTFNSDVKFSRTTFNANANFNEATFDANGGFYKTTFKDYVYFAGSAEKRVLGVQPHLNLRFSYIEKPDRFTFHTLNLLPHWFVNVDSRKFEFVNVNWYDKSVQEDIEALSNYTEHPHRLLAIAYRQLAINAEENHRYEEASRFRYNAMDIYRLERIRQNAWWENIWSRIVFLPSKLLSPFIPFLERFRPLHRLYWFASGYGERVGQAFIVLLFVLFSFACLYTQVGFTQSEKTPTAAVTNLVDAVGKPLSFRQALVHSFEVALLQKPEPKPLTLTARFLVGLETVLGPLQGALLALAVRRKFMR